MTDPRRFTTKAPVPFTIDDEEFHVLGAIPAEEVAALLDMQAGLAAEGTGITEQYDGIKRLFESTMIPESWERFVARLGDRSRPIDFNLLTEISSWLSGEVWAARPTSPPPSSTGSPEATGPTSTDGQPAEESTPLDSVGTDTSISSGIGVSVV